MREARKSSFRSLSSSSLSRSNTSLNDVGDALDRTLVVAAAESPRRSLKVCVRVRLCVCVRESEEDVVTRLFAILLCCLTAP